MKFQITSTKSQTNHSKRFWSFEFGILKLFVICILWFVIFSLNEAHAALISKPPTNLGLVGYWSMNEGTGSYAGDSSGNKNTGTLTNGPTWVDGKRGKALNFDGVNDYVNLGSGDIMSSNATLSLWFKMSPISDYKFLFSTKSNETDRLSVFTATNGRIVIQVLNGSNNAYVTTLDYDDNKWHHLVFVRNGNTITNGILYIDNNPVGIASWGNFGSDSTNNVIGIYEQTLSYPFNGLIDDVRVYNRALTAAEIQALYKSGQAKFASPSGTGLVGYWSMDEGSGSYATDFSGKNNAGVFPGGTANPTWVDGKRGKALNFDGSNDYVAITNANSTLKLTSSDGTFSAWVKPNTISGFDGIIGNNFGSGWWFILNAGKIAFWAATDAAVYDSNTVVPNGQWTHILVTYNNASKTATFYKNGVFDGSQVTANTIGNGGTTFYIGNDGRDGAGYPFDGLIDDVRIYNRALSAAEIQALYKSGAAKFAPPSNTGLVGYWSFDDGAGLSATDFSGKNNTGVFPGGTANPTWVNGKRGKALSFDGSNDYVNAGKAAGLDLTSTFTIAVWVKSSENSAAKPQGIIVRANYAGFEYGWMLDKDTANVFHFRGNGSAGTTYTRNDAGAYSDAAYTDQNWHHLTGVNTGGKNYLYVDGVLQAVSATEVIGSAGGTRPVVIGHRYSDLYTTEARTWNGLIDEVRVYNRALSASEVQALYNSR